MRVAFISAADLAGAGYALKAAFDATASDWEARAVCRRTNYLRYRTDLVWQPSIPRAVRQTILRVVAEADVLHLMNSPRALQNFPRRTGQTIVVHHLGTTYRRNPQAGSAAARAIGAIEVTDSIDLIVGPHVGWLPIPADLDALARLRSAHYRPSSHIRIAHAPTDRNVKDTALIMRAVNNLAQKYPITFDLIERRSNEECLRRKARADIFVDQLKHGFGLNAIECWAMGIPVVSGITTSPEGRERGRAMWDGLPWADATEETLQDVIERLIVDTEYRVALGHIGRLHAERWHSQQAVVDLATGIYQQAAVGAAA